MHIFITIILIAELIIAGALVAGICILDKKVNRLSENVSAIRPKLAEGMATARTVSEKLLKTVKDASEIVRIQSERYIMVVFKNVLIFLLLFFARGKSKKIISAVELAMSFGQFLTCK